MNWMRTSLALKIGVGLFLAGGWWALVWGMFVSTVLLWHGTFTINSLSHLLRRRRYAPPDDSRNNALIGFITAGEGWHNNHHADPTSARHGHHWWELDSAWLVIRLLMWLGLATKVAEPSPGLAAKFAVPTASPPPSA